MVRVGLGFGFGIGKGNYSARTRLLRWQERGGVRSRERAREDRPPRRKEGRVSKDKGKHTALVIG